MAMNVSHALHAWQHRKQPIQGVRTGRIASLSRGTVLVDYPGNPHGPLPALLSRQARESCERSLLLADLVEQEVLLQFESGDSRRPVVLDLVDRRPLFEESSEPSTDDRGRDLVLNGRRIVLNADAKVCLRCGGSSIELTQDGRIEVLGERLLSEATETHRIRGASVEIN